MFEEDIKKIKRSMLRKINDRDALNYASDNSKETELDLSQIIEYGSRILINGIEYINFSSNDYLGLSGNIHIRKSAKKAIDKFGFGACASRLLSGGTGLHRELEEKVAGFKRTDAALIFNSGYSANVSVIPAIASEGDIIFSDELNHASIIDGCRLSRAKKAVYRHGDVKHLSELIEKEHRNRRIVITDTIFSMDGDIAPLREIYEICLHNNAILYIDDAHGTGVLGGGYGALNHFNIKPEPWIIQMGTFSKALGSLGAFIAAGEDVIQWLINTARGFIYSTALPPCVVAASITALQILQEEPALVKRLWHNREKLFKGLKDMGFNTLNSETPIIPVVVGDTEATMKLSEELKEHQIYAPAIRPPTVRIPRIRFTVTASHTEKDIDELISALTMAKKEIEN
ncbi:MAG: 8-amino-7-oxononanoate synthase [Thermodesulfovibrio sp.]|nr:8-amino-7-oxononanoate synthase [Thermodesulfovibrio sp.]